MADPNTSRAGGTMDDDSPTRPSDGREAPALDLEDSGSRVEPPSTPTDVAWRRWCITIGVLMMLLSLLVSVLIPVQENMIYIANRAFMAVGGGLAAGGVLGFLNVEIKILRQTVVGGGGLAVFVLLFLVNPPAATAVANLPKDRKATLDAIKNATTHTTHLIPESAPSLEQLVHDLGYRSFEHFSVTASRSDIQAVAKEMNITTHP